MVAVLAGTRTTMESMSDTAQTRAQGPAEVRNGPLELDAVVVLDPCGDGKHGGLPATWRPLAEDVGVVWCRLPAIRRQKLAGAHLLPELTAGRRRVHLVGTGSSALLAVALAMSHRDLVRSLIVVDPPWQGDDLRDVGRFVDERTLVVRQIETSTYAEPGPGDRLPLGHPDVVAAIARVLLSADAGLAPEAPSLAGLAGRAVTAVRDGVAGALDALAGELGH